MLFVLPACRFAGKPTRLTSVCLYEPSFAWLDPVDWAHLELSRAYSRFVSSKEFAGNTLRTHHDRASKRFVSCHSVSFCAFAVRNCQLPLLVSDSCRV